MTVIWNDCEILQLLGAWTLFSISLISTWHSATCIVDIYSNQDSCLQLACN